MCKGERVVLWPVGGDYEIITRVPVTFGEGSTSSTVRIQIYDDDISEMLETFQVVLSPANSRVKVTENITIVEIIDSDGKCCLRTCIWIRVEYGVIFHEPKASPP